MLRLYLSMFREAKVRRIDDYTRSDVKIDGRESVG